MDFIEEKQEERREIPREELRRIMYRDLVSNHIISEKDLRKRVEEEVLELDNSVKVTFYILENHKSLFSLFNKSDAYYEAVKLARRLVKDGIIAQHDEQFHCTPYYFEKNDTKTMDAIDLQLIKYFPKSVIPTEHPFIRKEIKVESKPSLDAKVEEHLKEPKERKKIRVNPEFITVSKYLLQHHSELFANLSSPGSTFVKANYIAGLLAEKGIVCKRDESYHNTNLYFRREAINIMDRIDNAISNGVLEKARGKHRINAY